MKKIYLVVPLQLSLFGVKNSKNRGLTVQKKSIMFHPNTEIFHNICTEIANISGSNKLVYVFYFRPLQNGIPFMVMLLRNSPSSSIFLIHYRKGTSDSLHLIAHSILNKTQQCIYFSL